jgi:hypothetical protein
MNGAAAPSFTGTMLASRLTVPSGTSTLITPSSSSPATGAATPDSQLDRIIRCGARRSRPRS